MASRTPEGQVDRLALGVARGLSIRAASRAAGVASRTGQRWASDPAFSGRVRKIRERIMSQAVGKLTVLANRAAATMGELLKDTNDPDLRLKAARGVWADLTAGRDSLDLAARLEALEAHADATHKL